MKKFSKTQCLIISVLVLFLLILIYCSVFYNLAINSTTDIIITYIRLPAIVTAMSCGVLLSFSGLASQSYFRNPLATQDILGINAAGSLGAIIFLLYSSTHPLPSFFNIFTFSFFSSLLFSLLLITVSSFMSSILLFGILCSFLLYAINSMLIQIAPEHIVKSHLMWNFGTFHNNSPTDVYAIIFITTALAITFFLFSKSLNLLVLGKDKAFHEGVNLTKSKVIFLILNTLAVSYIISIAGPIGFIGITAPHLARMLFKSGNHFILFPLTALIGCVLCLSALCISQVIDFYYGHPPINSILALFSAPVLFYLLFQKRLQNNDLP